MEAWSKPALLVDPQSATLLAANTAGAALFATLPMALDGAMPAIRTLREISRNDPDGATAVPLVFWTSHGIEALTCDVARISTPPAGFLLLVRAVTAPARQTQTQQPPSTLPTERSSDEDRLRSIAQKIREGQRRFSTPTTPPASPTDGAQPAPPEPAPTGDPGTPRGIDLAKLAHELKTPVSAIAAASEVMKEGRFGAVENERYAAYIDGIHASARHALELIDRMLDRRIEQQPIVGPSRQFATLDLNAIAADCTATIQPLALAKSLTLSLQPSATKPIVTADQTAIRQIILNLITNAIKFTPSGGTITITTVGSRRGAAALTVQDTGPGMTAVAIAEALRPVPLNVPHTREGGGLGLGLPMSRALAEANGAALSIDSAPGRGTRVTIAFPGGPLVAI
jgi:hypothetical protein